MGEIEADGFGVKPVQGDFLDAGRARRRVNVADRVHMYRAMRAHRDLFGGIGKILRKPARRAVPALYKRGNKVLPFVKA